MIDFLENLENKFQRTENLLSEELIRNENLDSEIATYLEEYHVSEDKLSHFIQHKEHFTEKNWQELQEIKGKIEEKLQTDLSAISSRKPNRLKKAYKERQVPPHWLFVR